MQLGLLLVDNCANTLSEVMPLVMTNGKRDRCFFILNLFNLRCD